MASPVTASKGFSTEKPNGLEESDVEVAPGHLREIEVDVGKAIKETEEYDEDSEHSPYPEGA
jgi:hypothetical protein